MIRETRLVFEKLSVTCGVLAILLIIINLMEAAGLGQNIPFRATIIDLVRPLAYAFFPTAPKATALTSPLEIYPQATLVMFLMCLGSTWVKTVFTRMEFHLARLNLTFPRLLSWLIRMNRKALATVFNQPNDDLAGLSLIFMRIESPNDDIPIHSLVEDTLASEDFVSLLSCQSDAYCFQVVSIVEGVRFVNDLVGNLKAYNRTLIHPTDAISFTGVLHSVKSTTAFLEEDSYMRAVLECSGRNQLLVTTEAKKTYQREMKEAIDKGLDVPDLEMIYHGNYLTMGPRMVECEVFRLVKQL